MADTERSEGDGGRFFQIGRRRPMKGSHEKVCGKSLFVDDLDLPGLLHAKGVFSRFSHARILNIDTDRARRLTGVKAVATARDVPHNRLGRSVRDQFLLCGDKVRHLGDLVAIVAATDEETAEEAAGLIGVDYEPLPAVYDIASSLAEDAPLIHGGPDNHVPFPPDGFRRMRCGDIETGFKEADLVVEDTYVTQCQEHGAIETLSAVAKVESDGRLTIWATCSMPFVRAQETAEIVGMPFSKVRFKVPQVGGNFGGKNEAGAAPYAALLSLMTGKPVKWTWSREEEFLGSTVRHAYVMKHRTGVKRDGRLVAKKIETVGDAGAYCSASVWVLEKHLLLGCGPYAIPHVWIDGSLVYTNKQVSAAMRGYGSTQAAFAAESQMDLLARELGMDPLALRRKNLLKEGDTIPCGQKVEAVSIERCLLKAADEFFKARP